MTSAPEGLPRPTAGALTVYFLGPGFGESQVVVLPDDRVLVVDGCSREGVNHPEAVLRALGRTRIDLLVLTHPDLDHLKGVGELVRDFRPERIWRYPGMQTVREEVATQLLQAGAERARLVELREVLQALMAHGDGPVQACFDTRPWAPSADYRVHCLAPTAFDIQRALPDLGAQLHLVGSEVRVAPRFARIFRGEVRPGDHPNTLSLALVIEWGDRRILLAGDVENGAPDAPRSGWKGVLRALSRNLPDLSHLLRGVALVKVAHHGSEGAYWPEAWEGHAAPEKTAAVIAPFASSGLPREGPLRRLREHCDRLGVSADAGGAFQRAEAAGWSRGDDAVFDWSLPCIVATVTAAGPVRFARSATAALFR
jgi:beta-lactamase superfamily II metal-dependent hydrolase